MQPFACATQGWATSCCRKPSITLAETELIAQKSAKVGTVTIQTPSKITAITLLIVYIIRNLTLVQLVISKELLLSLKISPMVTSYLHQISFVFLVYLIFINICSYARCMCLPVYSQVSTSLFPYSEFDFVDF